MRGGLRPCGGDACRPGSRIGCQGQGGGLLQIADAPWHMRTSGTTAAAAGGDLF